MEEETEKLFLYYNIHLHKYLFLIGPDFENSLQVALSSADRWTVLQQEKNCLELVTAFTNVMLSPLETHYSKTGKVLPSNGSDKVSCIIIIFWGMNLYYRPNKYLKCAIHIWGYICPWSCIYLPLFIGTGNRTWAEKPFPLCQEQVAYGSTF